MRTIKIAICDDDELARNRVHEYLKEYFSTKDFHIEYYLYSDGSEFILSFQEYDIAVLDVQMNIVDGFRLRDLLRDNRAETQIIYLTDYKNLIRESYGYNVVGFVWKEEMERLSIYLDIITTDYYSHGVINLDGEDVELYPIIYVKQTFGHTVFFNENGEETSHTILMDALYKKLKSNREMQRISPSIMINLRFVKKFKIKEQEVILHISDDVPDLTFSIKPRYKEEVKQGYYNYLRKLYLNE